MTELERKAREYSDDKTDKGNYDYAVGDAVYFSRHSLEMAYMAGAGSRDKQLAEAKQIIKDFLLWENSWHEKTESKYALLKRAEDFIKE